MFRQDFHPLNMHGFDVDPKIMEICHEYRPEVDYGEATVFLDCVRKVRAGFFDFVDQSDDPEEILAGSFGHQLVTSLHRTVKKY